MSKMPETPDTSPVSMGRISCEKKTDMHNAPSTSSSGSSGTYPALSRAKREVLLEYFVTEDISSGTPSTGSSLRRALEIYMSL